MVQIAHFPAPQPLPLRDDPTVREVFADEAAGVSVINGNLNLTFAAVRADHSKSPATNYRVVTARLVIPLPAGANLQVMLSQLLADLKAKGIIKTGAPLPIGKPLMTN